MKGLLAKLGTQTYVLDLEDPCLDRPLPGGFEIRRRDALTLEADIGRDQDVNTLFEALTAAGVCVKSMRNKANRLEELFIRLLHDGKD